MDLSKATQDELTTLELMIAIAFEYTKKTLVLTESETESFKASMNTIADKIKEARKDIQFEEDRKYN